MEAIRSGSCTIHFGDASRTSLDACLADGNFSSVFILTDSNTDKHCLPVFRRNHPWAADCLELCVPEGEQHKTIHTCLDVWKQMSEAGADRKSLLINLGGGVVTDMGGFIASTYQRGIRFINVPTTLLSMVDASVGGKTGVDLGSLKNQIGVISDPLMVLIQPEYLATLNTRQLKSGFAEVLKHGLILDRAYWDSIKHMDLDEDLNPIIHKSVRLKNEVVQEDPREQGLRKILNYGHTLGHAIETFFLDHQGVGPLLHGEAIAIGMIMEGYLSIKACGLPQSECDEIRSVIFNIFSKVAIEKEHREQIIGLMRYDKKNARGKVLFSLLKRIGKASYNQEVSADQLHAAFDYYME